MYYHLNFFQMKLKDFSAYNTVLEDFLFKIRLSCVDRHVLQNVTKQWKLTIANVLNFKLFSL